MSRLAGLAALSGAVAVAAGAFGAHAATGRAVELFKTGGEYEMIHAVAALVAARIAGGQRPGALLLGGSLLFSGSLYALALGAPRWVGPITPIGGAAMILGWAWLGVTVFRTGSSARL